MKSLLLLTSTKQFPGTSSVKDLKALATRVRENEPDVTAIYFQTPGRLCIVYFKGSEDFGRFIADVGKKQEVRSYGTFFVIWADLNAVQSLLEKSLGNFEVSEAKLPG